MAEGVLKAGPSWSVEIFATFPLVKVFQSLAFIYFSLWESLDGNKYTFFSRNHQAFSTPTAATSS